MPAYRFTNRFLAGACALTVLAGCGGRSSSSGGTNPGGGTGIPSVATSLFVFQNNAAFFRPAPSSVLQFLRTANGMVSPSSNINGPANVIFDALTVDAAGNLYVAGQTVSTTAVTGAEILVYSPGASGKATPSRTIAGSATGMQIDSATRPYPPWRLDTASNLYVATDVHNRLRTDGSRLSWESLSFSPPQRSGNMAPTKSIAGDATGIFSPAQIAIDSANNIYVANSAVQGPASILVFNSSATGNAAPSSALTGDKTAIYFARGVALDAGGNIYVASLAFNPPPAAPLAGMPSILEYSPGASGNVPPIRIITGEATAMGEIGNLRVDSAGNIYVLSGTTILKFAAAATGNVAPIASITSSSYFQFDGSIAVQ